MAKICKKCSLEIQGDRCKPCRKAYKAEHYAKNAEKNRAYCAKRYLEDAEKYRERSRKYRERSRKYRERSRKYRTENRQALLARRREKRASDLDLAREKDRQYYIDHPDSAKARKKRYRSSAKTREIEREYGKRWRASNKDRISKNWSAYYEKNSDRLKAASIAWHKSNAERAATIVGNRRARVRNSAGSFTQSEFEAICKKQRGRCAECGQKSKLTRDHIVPLIRGGSNFAFNIQGLCRPCNSRKHAKIYPGTQHTLFDKIMGADDAN